MTGKDLNGLSLRIATTFFGNFKTLGPAQIGATLPILEGSDTLILSGTGSGKTEAAVAPAIQLHFEKMIISESPVILYISPTRALANDIYKRLEPALNHLGISIGIRHGEHDDTLRGEIPKFLITTPESLDILLTRKPLMLLEVEIILVDECHLLFNTHRGFQLAVVLRRLEILRQKNLQTIGMSATVGDGQSLWKFFRPGKKVAIVHAPNQREIQQKIYFNYNHEKLVTLIERIIDDTPIKVLIFVDSKRECDAIANSIRAAGSFDDNVFSHHASLSPEIRLDVEKQFSRLRTAICVATPTLELGIDIGDIDIVVLWGNPTNWQSFVQRIGRGNRKQQFVRVVGIVPEAASQEFTKAIAFQSIIQQIASNQFIGQEPFEIYGVAVQQILTTLSAREGGWIAFRLFQEIFKEWEYITDSDLALILDNLTSDGYAVKHKIKNWYGPGEKLFELVDKRFIWSNLPLGTSNVPLMRAGQRIGQVNSRNLFELNIGSVFNFGSNRFKVLFIDPEEIKVLQTTEASNCQLRFGGGMRSMEMELLEAERRFVLSNDSLEVFPKDYDRNLEMTISNLRQNLTSGSTCFFIDGDRYVYLTFAGLKMNSLIAGFFKQSMQQESDLCMVSESPLDFSKLPKSIGDFGELLGLVNSGERRSIFQDLLPVELIFRERKSQWISNPLAKSNLDRLRSSELKLISWKSSFSLI